MAHHYTINTQTTAGKRLQNEMRKRMRENIQRDQMARDNAASAEEMIADKEQSANTNAEDDKKD
ncbi:MAG: hypothetical protein K6G31_10035 [Paludibacteraceae bacterium]|nr:hypothetical protein [Paludibacteraceae bacterium]MBR6042894.1 hypothetical protein [Paludibacteraceae bacterium]MCR5569599.1 hypothetical protein [Paludibacteraceae bacterium]